VRDAELRLLLLGPVIPRLILLGFEWRELAAGWYLLGREADDRFPYRQGHAGFMTVAGLHSKAPQFDPRNGNASLHRGILAPARVTRLTA